MTLTLLRVLFTLFLIALAVWAPLRQRGTKDIFDRMGYILMAVLSLLLVVVLWEWTLLSEADKLKEQAVINFIGFVGLWGFGWKMIVSVELERRGSSLRKLWRS